MSEEATASMVSAHADAVIQIDDDTALPCVKFVMLMACSTIRRLDEDVELKRDAHCRQIIPLPGADHLGVAVALDVIHRVRPVSSLDKNETIAALECMDLLDCHAFRSDLHTRLWSWVQADQNIMPHVPRLVRDAALQIAVVQTLIARYTLWTDLCQNVLDVVRMDFELAQIFLKHLVRFFPAIAVLEAILERLVQPTVDKVVELCSCHGTYYHPDEVADVLKLLRGTSPKGRGGKTAAPSPWPARLAESLLRALDTYQAAPRAASKVHGSFIVYADITASAEPTASALLTFEPEYRSTAIIKVADGVRVQIRRDTGEVWASFLMTKVDDQTSTHLRVRVTCTSQNRLLASTEVWYEFDAIDPGAWVNLTEATRRWGHEASQQAVLRDPWRVRFDLFHSPF
jgi:hypothetical protein